MSATTATNTSIAPPEALVRAEETLLATLGIPVERHEVSVGGVRIHYLTCGEGEPLVLVHGRGNAGAHFAPIFAELAKERRVIALDLPGWGLSEKPPFTGHTAEDALNVWRGALLGFLDVLDIPQTDLLGHSMGGLTALGLAVQHPDRVRRLVLVDSGGLGVDTPLDVRLFFRIKPERLLRWFGPRMLAFALQHDNPQHKVPRDAYFDFTYAVMSQAEVIPSGGRAFDRWTNLGGVHLDLRGELKDLQMPVLLMWGDRDHLMPYTTALQAARRMRTARLVAFTNVGHSPFAEKPDVFTRVLIGWLDGYGAPSRV
jgi:pimeloyl-ACP methyl ester carboxylesterase